MSYIRYRDQKVKVIRSQESFARDSCGRVVEKILPGRLKSSPRIRRITRIKNWGWKPQPRIITNWTNCTNL